MSEEVEQAPEVPPTKEEKTTQKDTFKKDESPKVYISEDELKALEQKVLSAKQPSEKALYEKAVAEVRSEIEKARAASAQAQAEQQRDEKLQALERELQELKNRPIPSGRKGVATTVQGETNNLFQKTPDGRYAVPRKELEKATIEAMFKEHWRNVRPKNQ